MKTLSRRDMLIGSAATAGAAALAPYGPAAKAAATGPARNLVIAVAGGGWDTTYVLDPKPGIGGVDAPAGGIEDFEGLPVYIYDYTPAPEEKQTHCVREFFTAHAGLCCVINGIQTQSIVHSDCAKRVLTGTPSEANPDFGAITAFEHGGDLAAPYLVLGQLSYTGQLASLAARAGTAGQLTTLLQPQNSYASFLDPSSAVLDPTDLESALIRKYVKDRAEQMREVRGQRGTNKSRLDDFIASLDRGDRLADVGSFGSFEFTRDLREQVNLALTAFEEGLSHVVQMQAGDWDTHTYNDMQGQLNQEFFDGLKFLVDELTARPGTAAGSKMIDETTVVVISEMGRTPRLNEEMGKDHWPVTSALVVGAGVRGGQVVGGTNDLLEAMNVSLSTGALDDNGAQLQYGNFAAGILNLVGVDPKPYLPNSEPFGGFCA